MKLNLRWEYGRRLNSNVRILAIMAIVLGGIFLALNSNNSDFTSNDITSRPLIEIPFTK
jgi:hypothetical protein